jgi:hypothetical protein
VRAVRVVEAIAVIGMGLLFVLVGSARFADEVENA